MAKSHSVTVVYAGCVLRCSRNCMDVWDKLCDQQLECLVSRRGVRRAKMASQIQINQREATTRTMPNTMPSAIYIHIRLPIGISHHMLWIGSRRSRDIWLLLQPPNYPNTDNLRGGSNRFNNLSFRLKMNDVPCRMGYNELQRKTLQRLPV